MNTTSNKDERAYRVEQKEYKKEIERRVRRESGVKGYRRYCKSRSTVLDTVRLYSFLQNPRKPLTDSIKPVNRRLGLEWTEGSRGAVGNAFSRLQREGGVRGCTADGPRRWLNIGKKDNRRDKDQVGCKNVQALQGGRTTWYFPDSAATGLRRTTSSFRASVPSLFGAGICTGRIGLGKGCILT